MRIEITNSANKWLPQSLQNKKRHGKKSEERGGGRRNGGTHQSQSHLVSIPWNRRSMRESHHNHTNRKYRNPLEIYILLNPLFQGKAHFQLKNNPIVKKIAQSKERLKSQVTREIYEISTWWGVGNIQSTRV